jgi:hypothetical protein
MPSVRSQPGAGQRAPRTQAELVSFMRIFRANWAPLRKDVQSLRAPANSRLEAKIRWASDRLRRCR